MAQLRQRAKLALEAQERVGVGAQHQLERHPSALTMIDVPEKRPGRLTDGAAATARISQLDGVDQAGQPTSRASRCY
jgi:hypothetical protein